jgi:hypothetical protein
MISGNQNQGGRQNYTSHYVSLNFLIQWIHFVAHLVEQHCVWKLDTLGEISYQNTPD